MPLVTIGAALAAASAAKTLFSKDKSQAQGSVDPWNKASPWMQENIVTGRQLQGNYEKNPFSQVQKDYYQRTFDDLNSYRDRNRSMMSRMQNAGGGGYTPGRFASGNYGGQYNPGGGGGQSWQDRYGGGMQQQQQQQQQAPPNWQDRYGAPPAMMGQPADWSRYASSAPASNSGGANLDWAAMNPFTNGNIKAPTAEELKREADAERERNDAYERSRKAALGRIEDIHGAGD